MDLLSKHHHVFPASADLSGLRVCSAVVSSADGTSRVAADGNSAGVCVFFIPKAASFAGNRVGITSNRVSPGCVPAWLRRADAGMSGIVKLRTGLCQ